jgi:hypothetical protein
MCGQSPCCIITSTARGATVTVGACMRHAMQCSAGVSLFFFVKKCHVVGLLTPGGCVLPPPYVDSHGETDIMLASGVFSPFFFFSALLTDKDKDNSVADDH